jgi:mannose-1-phosphate guanylyltransferase
MPIKGIPLLEYWLSHLTEAGISPILINLHHHANLVRAYLEHSRFAGQVSLVYEEELLLTAGTLLKNREFFGNESLILIHADNLCFCDFRAFMHAHEQRPQGTVITMMTFTTPTPQTCGIVELDERNVVQAFHEKVPNPPGNHANAAVYILAPEIFDFLASLGKEKIDFSTEVIPHYMRRIVTFHNDVYHSDIGDIESLLAAQNIQPEGPDVHLWASRVGYGTILEQVKSLARDLAIKAGES